MDDKTGSLERLKAQFSESERVDMSSVKVGDIIYVPLDASDGMRLKDGYSERRKYIVVVGFTPENVAVGVLLINSKIASFKSLGELYYCQYPLLHRDYPAILDYDSSLDCSEIFELPKLKISSKGGKLKGCLTEEDLERVLDLLRETDVIKNSTKRRFGII